MLRKVGRKRARVPLTQRVDYSHFMLTDESVWMKSRLIITPTMVRLSGISELALLSWHPESVLPLSLLSFMDYDCGRCGSTSYLSAKGENKKSPQDSSSNLWGLVQEPGGLYLQYVGMKRRAISLVNSNLTSAKLGNNSRPRKGH